MVCIAYHAMLKTMPRYKYCVVHCMLEHKDLYSVCKFEREKFAQENFVFKKPSAAPLDRFLLVYEGLCTPAICTTDSVAKAFFSVTVNAFLRYNVWKSLFLKGPGKYP